MLRPFRLLQRRGYWQPRGEALVHIEGGGDFGARWNMDISSDRQSWYLRVDYVDADDYDRGYNRGHNEAVYDLLAYRFGVEAADQCYKDRYTD